MINIRFFLGRPLLAFTVCLVFTISLTAQESDSQRLIAALLADTELEEDLQHLCDAIGGRETGSPANEQSVDWIYNTLKETGLKTWKQEVPVPSLWLEKSTKARISGTQTFEPLVVAKYHSPVEKASGALISVGMGSEEEFAQAADEIAGQFILIETDLCRDINGLFAEYTQAFNVEQRALQYGAQGIVFMSSRPKKLLYRFTTSQGTDNALVQIVMAREDAQRCKRLLSEGPLDIDVDIEAVQGQSFTTHNVIAEIPGSDLKEEVIVIGAHFDSWALGTGANDNGCNVSLVMDIAKQMQALGITPRRTIRFALWNGEEQGFFGSRAYTEEYADELDNHKMAMSIDIGSGRIIGFFMNGNPAFEGLLDELLEPVEAFGPFLHIPNAIIGTDNLDFMLEGVPNLVANHKPYNYGLNYHAASDTYDKVDLKSLKINSVVVGTVALGMANHPDLPLQRWSRAQIDALMQEQSLEFPMRMFGIWEDWQSMKRGRQ